jgi:hypothetical protein
MHNRFSDLDPKELAKRFNIAIEEAKKDLSIDTKIKNPTLKGGVCYVAHYGPQSRFSGIQKSSNLRCPGSLDLHDWSFAFGFP